MHLLSYRAWSLLTVAVVVAGCSEVPQSPDPEPSGRVATPEPDPTAEPDSTAEPVSTAQPLQAFVPGIEIVPEEFEPEEGFTLLSVEDFVPIAGNERAWQEIDGVIVCSGEPKGYLHSRKPYGNYTWRAEFRFAPVDDGAKAELANTGFMIHIQPPHKIWPRSLEVQGRWDQMCTIKSNGGVPDLVITDDPAARESARRPVGEWNAVEIVSKDGSLTARLNGKLICTSEPGELREGLIGLQSELFEVHFRRMRIREEE